MPSPRKIVKRPSDSAIFQAAEGFALIAAVLRAEAALRGSTAGLSAAQTRTMALLAQTVSGMRLSEIAGRLGVSSASASDTVAGLVRRTLVTRRSDPKDGRAVRFTTRPKTSRTEPGGGEPPETALQDSLGDLSRADRTALQRILVRLILSLQQRGRIPIARACVNCRFFRPQAHPGRALPHHCDYVDSPFGDASLRIFCREFEGAEREGALANHARWLKGARLSK